MKYQLTVSFEADREMELDEMDDMMYAVQVQIMEPMSDLRTAAIDGDIFQVEG